MTLLPSIALIISIAYAIFIFFVLIGFFKQKKSAVKTDIPSIGISVLLPFKNEKKHLIGLLESLEKQSHPLFEVIFINDHSNDDSERLIQDYSSAKLNIRLLHLGHEQTGKKAALEEGIKHSNFDWIVTTDADCLLPENWLSSFAKSSGEKMLCAGRVEIQEGKGFWNHFQQLEMISIQAVSFAFGRLCMPISMSGANLFYPKELFQNLQPYQSNKTIPSGDDIYFLQALKKNNQKVYFIDQLENRVQTQATSVGGYFSQRIRWMKKGSSFTDLHTVLVGMMIFLSAVVFIFATGYQLFTAQWNALLLISLGLKIIVDFLLLFLVTHHWKKKALMIWFIPSFILNMAILSVLPLVGWFIPVSWKGRKI